VRLATAAGGMRHPPHAYELMHIGWIVGATDDKRETMGKQERRAQGMSLTETFPGPYVSFYFYFSYIFVQLTTQIGPHRTTHHPPPASRATARGVDHGWNDNDNK
jgi:hypothetical protein